MLLLRKTLAHRPVLRCRNDSTSTGSVATVAKPDVAASETGEIKMQSTISTLDSLLGEQAKPKPAPAPKQEAKAATSQSGVFSAWPGTASSKLPSAAPQRKGRTQGQAWESLMGFEGMAPEIVNGRCAMLGFWLAITAEFDTGESVFSQVIAFDGVLKLLIVVAVVTLASFAPAIRGVPMDEVFNKNPKKVKAWGPFAPDAELINGRAAMVGLAAMVLLEGTAGQAFFL